MGGNQQSKPQTISSNFIAEDEQFFILYDLAKMKLFNGSNDILYYWIDPRIHNGENLKNANDFRKNGINVQTLSSIESFKNQLTELDSNQIIFLISAASLPDDDYKYLTREKRIIELILFCKNQERAELLKQNFPTINKVGYDSQEVIELVKQCASNLNQNSLIENCLLFMNQEDTALMNKYRLNYHFLVNQQLNEKSKSQFAALAKRIFPQEQGIIDEFAKNYKLELSADDKHKQTLGWAFKNSFYWKLVEKLPKATSDPRKLAYLRHPVQDLHQAIFQGYKKMQNKPKKVYVVMQLSEDEQLKLQQNYQNYLIFTTFVKGYTNQQIAVRQLAKLGKRGFKLDISFDRRKADENLDFGFARGENQNTPNIIFNLYNVFQVTQITPGLRQCSLMYGSLAKASFIRGQGKEDIRKKLKQPEINLLRNYDYLIDLMKKIKNQGNILTLSGYFKDSIELYDRKLDEVRRTNKPAAILDQYKIQKAQTLILDEQYQEAESLLNQVTNEKLKVVAQIYLLEIHFIFSNRPKIDSIIPQIQSNLQNLKKWGMFDEYLKAKNFMGLNFLHKQQPKTALKIFKDLLSQGSQKYDYKVEGISMMHEIYRNLALCETKIKNYQQAQNLLKSSKKWQQCCQGRSSSLLLTQRLIQSIHHLKGDKQKVLQIQQNIQKRVLNQSTVDINFVDMSKNIMSSKKSIMQSLLNIDLNEINHIDKNEQNNGNNKKTEQPSSRQFIEQSLISVDMNARSQIEKNEQNNANNKSIKTDQPSRQLIEQSAVNISL